MDDSLGRHYSRLRLIETLYIDGIPDSSLGTLFAIGMPDNMFQSQHEIYNEMLLGDNSQSVGQFWSGSYYQNGGFDTKFEAKLGYSTSIAKVINFGVSLTYVDQKKGATNYYTPPAVTRVAGLKINKSKKVTLKDDEQYLAVNVDVLKVPSGYSDSNFTGNTTLKSIWKFDFYHDLDLQEYIDDAIVSLNYNVQS
ncbi:hypothetical protein M6D81_31460 [Paenibacillus sp. J5C_2022]|uniref:hypothetical protein n=1 Tax=Paenibacillus sp. J5C2022 TaxID=2977129 RepID=UPI0021CF0267|nr:hypothetical protein [Paenibacillus sp. J5C2022]MCU6713225.1 hypothetical protein [Paenibacillus sp. J5C2022]